MFNLYVVSSGHDKVSDVGRATTWRLNFKMPSLQTKGTKKKDLPKTSVLMGKQFKDFGQKGKTEKSFSTFKEAQWNTVTLNPSIDYGP